MKRTGGIGIATMVMAFGLAILASLWLTIQARNQTLADLIPYALAAFGLIFALMIVGLRLWLVRSAEPDGESDVEQQRRMLERLTVNVPTDFASLSRWIEADEATLELVLRELVRLRLFNGYIDWRGQRLCPMMPQDIVALNACVVCGADLELSVWPITCSQCATVYSQVRA